jgi:hypothetical protein
MRALPPACLTEHRTIVLSPSLVLCASCSSLIDLLEALRWPERVGGWTRHGAQTPTALPPLPFNRVAIAVFRKSGD